MGNASTEHLYEISAFAQHYYHLSPLIDFTKSLYPSLSFALKDRTYFDEDIVLYVLKLRDMDDYTSDIQVADKWLNELNVYVSYFDETSVKNLLRNLLKTRRCQSLQILESILILLRQMLLRKLSLLMFRLTHE